MKLVRLFVLIVACVALAAPLALAQTAKPVAKSAADPAAKLPAAILTAFRTSYPNATIKGAAKETEDGKTAWEVESIDMAHHRLFTVAGNKLLVAVDSTSGKVLSTLPIGPGVDAAAYDPATGLVFASSSDSTLTVAQADAAGKLALVQTLPTPPRSRTMTLDPKTHRIYVSAAEFTAPPPAAPGAQPQRPQMVPESFKVVVFDMAAAAGK